MTDLWTEAGRDAEADALETRLTTARLAAAGLWPFLASAETPVDFENRLALQEDKIAHVASVQAAGDPVLFGVVHSSLREQFAQDFMVLHTARMQARANRVSDLNEVIKSGGTGQVEGQPIDLNTAAMILRVYNAATPEQQATFDSLSLHELIRIAWEHNAKVAAARQAARKQAEKVDLGDGFEAEIKGGKFTVVHTPSGEQVASGDGGVQEARRAYMLADTSGLSSTSARKVAEGEQVCSVCGDKIAKNPEGDGYHHDNGKKHDHEATAGGSKESSKTAGIGPTADLPFAVKQGDTTLGLFPTREAAETAQKSFSGETSIEEFKKEASRRTAVVSKGDVVHFAGETRTVKSVEDRGEKPGQDRYKIVFEDGLETTHPSGDLRSADDPRNGKGLFEQASRRTAGENPFAKKDDEDEKKPEEKAVDAVEEAKEDQKEAEPSEDPAAPAPEVPAPADPAAQTPAATQENGAAAIQPMLDAGYEPQTKGGKTLEEALAAGEPIQFLPPAAPAATTPTQQAPVQAAASTGSRRPFVREASLLEVPAWDLYQYGGRMAKDRASQGDLRILESATRQTRGADRFVTVKYEGYQGIDYDPDAVFIVALPGDPMFYGGGTEASRKEAVVQWTDEGGDAWTASGGSGSARIEKVDGEYHWETDGDSGESSSLDEAKSQAESKIASRRTAADLPKVGDEISLVNSMNGLNRSWYQIPEGDFGGATKGIVLKVYDDEVKVQVLDGTSPGSKWGVPLSQIASRRVAADLPEVGARVTARQPGGDFEVEGQFEGLDERGLAMVRYTQDGFYGGGREYVGRFSPANVHAAALHTAPGGGPHPPYEVEERDGKFVVVNGKGEVKGTHDTKEEARAQQSALYANTKSSAHTATNPYSPESNPYIPDANPTSPGVPDDMLDGPAAPANVTPTTTKPRQVPSGGDQPARPAQEKVTQGFASLGGTPVICRRCGARGRVAKVTADLSCQACGTGDDLDYDDSPVTATANQATGSTIHLANPFGDPSMPMDLLPEGTPDQDRDVEPVREGDQKARKVVVPKGSPVYTQQALGTPDARTAKIEQIAAAVLSTNPGMPREAALRVAEQTLTRYPKMLAEAAMSPQVGKVYVVTEVLDNDQPYDTEGLVVHKNGTKVWVLKGDGSYRAIDAPTDVKPGSQALAERALTSWADNTVEFHPGSNGQRNMAGLLRSWVRDAEISQQVRDRLLQKVDAIEPIPYPTLMG